MKDYTYLIGSRNSSLQVISVLPFVTNQKRKLLLKCKCGNLRETLVGNFIKGTTHSCGCQKKKRLSNARTRHGMKKSSEYHICDTMKARCNNPNHKSYSVYGGAGIKVCKEWESFVIFLKDMGLRPSRKHTLDRIDNSLGYSKINCKWSTSKEQADNRKSTVWIEYNGQKKPLCDWARELLVGGESIRRWQKKGKEFNWIYNYFLNKKNKNEIRNPQKPDRRGSL